MRKFEYKRVNEEWIMSEERWVQKSGGWMRRDEHETEGWVNNEWRNVSMKERKINKKEKYKNEGWVNNEWRKGSTEE